MATGLLPVYPLPALDYKRLQTLIVRSNANGMKFAHPAIHFFGNYYADIPRRVFLLAYKHDFLSSCHPNLGDTKIQNLQYQANKKSRFFK